MTPFQMKTKGNQTTMRTNQRLQTVASENFLTGMMLEKKVGRAIAFYMEDVLCLNGFWRGVVECLWEEI